MKKLIVLLLALIVVMPCMWSAIATTENEMIGVYTGEESTMGLTAEYTLELRAGNGALLSISVSGYGQTENAEEKLQWYLNGDQVTLYHNQDGISGVCYGDRIVLTGMGIGGTDLTLWKSVETHAELNAECQVGDVVTFGTYPQTAAGNDRTPIEWLVLARDGDKALLISKYALSAQAFDLTTRGGVTWENCMLRSWLNDTFYSNAFSGAEKSYVVTTEICEYGDNGFITQDKIFLLSKTEAETYFKDDESRACKATDFALRLSRSAGNDYGYSSYGYDRVWWLRSTDFGGSSAAHVDQDGGFYTIAGYYDFVYNGNLFVRPCVWVRLTDDTEAETGELTDQDGSKWDAGNVVTFGTYPHTESGTDRTPIEWIVLARDGDKALLISRYALDAVPYNTVRTDVTWETCSLRTWLNNDFYNKAFGAEEKRNIVLSQVAADKNPAHSTNPGNDTMDNVFLLSITEANQYFKDDSSRVCAPTDYAVKNGAYTESGYKVKGRASCWWWLRSPGYRSNDAAHVYCGGSVSDFGGYVNSGYDTVRPCVWVRIADDTEAETGELTDRDVADDEQVSEGAQGQKWDVGEVVTFGTYPQTESGNDSTPIQWLVLARDGDKALVISRYALDCVQYNTEWTDVTWETCSLRKWLNNDFYNKAFSAEEKTNIVTGKVTADENPKYSTNPGNDTMDNVFLLSIPEVNQYFKDDNSRMCAPTDYAVKNGASTSSSRYKVDGRASCWWWLRSPGFNSNFAALVNIDGSVYDYGNYVTLRDYSVRPCVWVRLF